MSARQVIAALVRELAPRCVLNTQTDGLSDCCHTCGNVVMWHARRPVCLGKRVGSRA